MCGSDRCRHAGRAGSALAERRSGRIVVTMRGDHDVATAEALRTTVAGAMALGGADVVLDMSLVGFLDASTIGVVASARDELRRGRRSLSVRDPSACARRLLGLCGLGDLVEPDAEGGPDLVVMAAVLSASAAHPAGSGSLGGPRPPARGRLSLCPAPAPD
jgi:anti-anti-sigma factor